MKSNTNPFIFLVGICLLIPGLISCTANVRPEEDITTVETRVVPAAEAPESSEEEEDVTITLTLPVFSPHVSKTPIALVNDVPVMLEELSDEMKSLHMGMEQETIQQSNMRESLDDYYLSLLDRIISSRLIVEEALNIGLNEQPGMQNAIQEFSDKVLRQLLVKDYLKGVTLEVPEDEVTRLYQDEIREYNLSSLSFKSKEDADRASQELEAGADFDTLAANLIEKGDAEGTEKGDNYVKATNLLPRILNRIRNMEVGSVSPVVEGRTRGTYLLFKIEDIRYPENPDALERARQRVLIAVRKDTIQKFVDSLVKKYATVDNKLLKSVDFDVLKKDSDALNDDKRIVAAFDGEEPLTVSDVAKFLNKEHFHGVEKTERSINEMKRETLRELLQKKVLDVEAHRRCLDKTDEYNEKITKFEHGLLFGSFIDKVISPDIKITREDVETYYAEHRDEFMTPEMMRIDSSLVFSSRKFAEDAARKLQEGTDFKWMLDHAEGQVDKDPDTLLHLGGRFLTVSGLTPDVRRAVDGAKKGHVRIYESPEGDFYVLIIKDQLASQAKSLDDVKSIIAQRLSSEKIGAAVEDYVKKLKEVYDVRIFINLDK
jgi:hypothetical protein